MKKMMILAVMMVMTISANAMNYNAAKHEALFLSDKMAYELNLTAAQYEAVYEINLDYLMSLNGHGDMRQQPIWLTRAATSFLPTALATSLICFRRRRNFPRFSSAMQPVRRHTPRVLIISTMPLLPFMRADIWPELPQVLS